MLFLGMVTAGLVGAAILLWMAIDVEALIRSGGDAPPPVKEIVARVELPELPATGSWTAYIYESPATAHFFPDSQYHVQLKGRWESLLQEVGARVTRISNADEIDALGSELIVLASAVCLDAAERESIRTHIERGGQLLATWAIGARDGDCKWDGYDFLQEITDASAVSPLDGRPFSYLTTPAGLPISTGLPPGQRVELSTEAWIALNTEEPGIFWSDWSLNPLAGPRGGAMVAAITRKTVYGGRVAWFGYQLGVGAYELDRRIVERMAANALLWASGHVLVDVSPWPAGYRSALAVTQDVEHSHRNSRRLARRMQQLDVPVTFFAVSQLVREEAVLAEQLRSAGEIGSHSADHRQVGGWPLSKQLASLNRTFADISAWSGEAPLGFRPPREEFDSATLEAWRRVGGLYVAATNSARSAAPELLRVKSGPVVVLPRVVDDDYAVMVIRGERSADSLAAALHGGLEKMRSLGGLDLLTVHTQLIDSERRIAAIAVVARSAVEAGDVWIATGAEIAKWWASRSELELEVECRDDGSALLTVTNGGEVPVSSAWLRVHLPEEPRSYAAPEVGDEILRSRYLQQGMSINLPAVGPGESITILIPRQPPDSADALTGLRLPILAPQPH